MITYGSITVTDMEEGSQFWTTTTAPTTPDYTFTISNLTGDPNTDVKIGDIIFYDVYKYTIIEVGSTTVKADNRQSIQGQNGKMLYGTCPDTAIGTAAKVVTCAEATELYAGLAITIKFTKGNSASAPTLNVNGLGAKNIYFGGANASSSNLFIFAANSEIQFIYNGTAFVPIGYPCTYYGTCTIAAGTAAKTSTIAQAVICKGTVVNLQMTNANTVANPTLNVSSTGAKAIYANGAKPTADSPYNWIASSTVSFTFDGQYWRLGDTSSLNKIDVVNTLAQSAKDTADSKVTTYYSASTSAPSNPSTGDLWIKTNDNKSLWRWNGTSWESVDNSNIQTALDNAASAQSTADGKIVTYAQDNQPNTGSEGDLWIDTNDNNKLYRYNETSSTWVEVAPEYLIGGRNFIRKPIFTTPTIMNGLTFSREDSEITVSGTNTKTNANWGGVTFCPFTGLYFKVGEVYTLTSYGNMPNTMYIQINGKNTSNGNYALVTMAGNGSNKSVTFTVPSTHNEAQPATAAFVGIMKTAGAIDCSFRIKLEKGNVPTDWTPAPEDIDSAIDEAQSTADAALSQSVWYATCDTVATEVNKVATISPTTTAFTLSEGVIVNVKFSTTNSGTVDSLTLNINNTGAKPIKYIYNGSYSNIPSAGYLKANQMYKFAYDGTYWIVELIYNTNTNTVGVYGGTGFIAGTNGIKQYSLIMEDGNGTWQSFTTTYGTGTSKPRNTVGFKPNKILYMSGKDNYAAGSACTTCYDGYSINLQYSTNCGTTLVIGKPVYLVGTINNNDGLFYLEPTWWTQTEPVIEDGCIYIYLGTAYNTSSIYFTPENPIYIFKYGEFMKLTEATEIEAATALATANGKNTSYYQAEEPTLGTYKDGDTWFKMGLANIDGTKTGSIVSVDGNVKINDLVVDINAVQAGSGDPSPDNVRPINGWTGCNVSVSGTNIWDEQWELGGIVNASGANYTATDRIRSKNYSPCVPNTAYYFKAPTPYLIVYWYKQDKTYIDYVGASNTVKTAPDNAYYFRLVLQDTTSYDGDISINYPSTDTDYHTYTGHTYPISWETEAGTVYGGTVDLVSGVLTVTHGYVDLGTLTWEMTSADAHIFRSTNLTNHRKTDEINYKCSIYLSMESRFSAGQMEDKTCKGNNSQGNYFYIRDVAYSDATTFKQAMNGVQLVYELATPQTYQLTPPQISLLANQVNNIWADTGDVTLTGSVETIDAAVEVYQYDENDGWVLTPYGSGVFATIDAGKITTGTLSTILIKSNNNDYWNLSPIDVTDGNNVYKANTLQTNHLIAEDDVYVYGGSGSRVYIPADTGSSVPDGTDDAYIDLQEKGLIIQSNLDNEYVNSTLKTIYPSDGTATYKQYHQDGGAGHEPTIIDAQSYNTVFASSNEQTTKNKNDKTIITGEVLKGACRTLDEDMETVIYDYDDGGLYSSTVGDELTYDEHEIISTVVTTQAINIDRGRLYDYYYPDTYRPSPVSDPVNVYRNFQRYVENQVRISPYEFRMSQVDLDPNVDSETSYIPNTQGTYNGDYILDGFRISLEDHAIETYGDYDWNFSMNGSFYLNDVDLSLLTKREYTQASSSLSISSAWGWVTCLTLTLPANLSSHTIVYKITGSVQFSTIAQWKAQVLSIYYNGDHHNRHIYSSSIGTTGCNWDITHFIEIVPSPSPITIYLMAQCEVACNITDRWFLAEAVYYKD